MTLPYSFIGTGTYTNAASALPTTVALSDKPDLFMTRDITDWGAANTAVTAMESWIYPFTMAAGSYRQLSQISAASGSNYVYAGTGTANGFTFFDLSNPPTFAQLTGTAIDKTTWVVLMTNTGSIAVGDTVRLINPVGMLQAGGITAQVTAVSVNTSITLGFVATAVTAGANFTANATAVSILKYIPGRFYPRELQVMHITQAAAGTAKVYFARPNDFTSGEIVDFNIPATYGMTQMNFSTLKPQGAPRVLVTTNTTTESSITIDTDTSGFTAFAYPTSAGSIGKASPPRCFPAGSGIVPLNGSLTLPQPPPGTNLQDSFDNRNQFLMYIGSSVVGANSAVMQWTAWKASYGNLSNA